MIDRTYGHLATDPNDAIRSRLEARAGRSGGYLASEAEASASDWAPIPLAMRL
jgi:hypothetical protein